MCIILGRPRVKKGIKCFNEILRVRKSLLDGIHYIENGGGAPLWPHQTLEERNTNRPSVSCVYGMVGASVSCV